MKFNFLLITILTFSTSVFGQNTETKVRMFLDTILIDEYFLYDPIKIDDIVIGQGFDSINSPKGAIYIKSKNKLDYNFLSFGDIKRLNNINRKTPVVCMLNDKPLIDHLTSYKIDSSYILKVQIMKIPQSEWTKKKDKNVIIINVMTKTKTNIEAEKITCIK